MSSKQQNYYGFYVAIALLAVVLIYFSTDHPVRKANMYGVVESPKVRLNHPRKVVVLEVNVTPGKKVAKGDMLMRLQSDAITNDLQSLAYRERQLEADKEKELFEFEIQKNTLDLELFQARAEWEQARKELELTLARDATWLKNFSTLEVRDTTTSSAWKAGLIEQTYQSKVAENKLKQSLLVKRRRLQVAAFETQKEELQLEKERLQAEKESLTLRAPASGTIDNVFFMEGQTADGFSDLLSLLPDENKFVRAYITDQTTVTSNFSTVMVQSALEPEKSTTATYVGSGGVEVLPLLMQQSPIQQSGKEIFFRLDSTEGWLQGEKVMILTP